MFRMVFAFLAALNSLIILPLIVLTVPATADDAKTCAEAKVGDSGIDVQNACTRLIESPTLYPADHAQAYVNRAAQHQLWNNIDAALADYGEAIRINPGGADAYFERGTIYWLFKKDYDRAIADFGQVIQLAPQDAKGYMGRGTAYSLKNDFDQALADYDLAIGLDRRDVLLFGLRAYTYERKGDLVAALADYRYAAMMNPRSRDEIDAAKRAAGDFKRVAQMLAVLGITPPDPAPRRPAVPVAPVPPAPSGDARDRASCEKIGAVAAESILSCTRLIASGSISGAELASLHVWRGSHFRNASDHDDAIDDYTTALEINSKNLAAYLGRALSHESTGNVARALADYRAVATLDPQMKYAADAIRRLEEGPTAKQ